MRITSTSARFSHLSRKIRLTVPIFRNFANSYIKILVERRVNRLVTVTSFGYFIGKKGTSKIPQTLFLLY